MTPRIAALLAVLVLAAPAYAKAPQLGLPLDCVLGQTCWVLNYPDTDSGPKAQDFACRRRSYDKHDGTDFALRDSATLTRGVTGRAAAAGTVIQTRDGEEDGRWLAGHSAEIRAARKECGNRVAIDHGDGWITDYCHFRRGSVLVKPGDRVAAGQALGLVGLSGMTAFPHMHMSLLHKKPGRARPIAVDPFTGADLSAGCGRPGHSLWAAALAYEPVSLYAAGFATAIPSGEAVTTDAASPEQLPATAPALVLWGALFGVTAGDRVTSRITGPDGTDVLNNIFVVEATQAWRVLAAGKRHPDQPWPPGNYQGTVTLERAGIPPQNRTVTVELR